MSGTQVLSSSRFSNSDGYRSYQQSAEAQKLRVQEMLNRAKKNRDEKRKRLNRNSTPSVDENIDKELERRMARYALVFSSVVLGVKLFNHFSEKIDAFLFERKLVTYEVITESGQIMFTNTWQTAVRYSNVWLPLAGGLLSTYFTWMCVYLDSSVPGVYPPSPLSPKKYRVQSGHTFHLNYVFAILVGVLVTSYMYFREFSIQF